MLCNYSYYFRVVQTYGLLFLLILIAGAIQGCGETKNTGEECEHDTQMRAGKEPEPKPMARMMRAMYQQGEQMRKQILAGESISPEDFPLLSYHNQVPTDPAVLGAEFDQHHLEFARAWEDLLKSPDTARYNLMLQACVGCHQDHCPGPIRKIRKLNIEF